MRYLILTLVLLAGASNAAEVDPPPPRDLETIKLKPSIREIPRARTYKFEPRGDLTPQELEQLGPYLKGKPVYPADERALGPAMRHLKEVQ